MSTGYDEDEDAYDDDLYDDSLEWTEEDEERYQARQHEERRRKTRRRRQALSFTLLVLLVLGAGVVGAGVNQGWWEWPFSQDEAAAPNDRCTPSAGGIASPEDTRVTVLNATDTRGLAATIGSELTRRGYTVDGVGNEEGETGVTSVEIRYGPGTEAQARSVAAHFRKVTLVDDERTGGVVDLVIGPQYSRMNDAAAAAAAIAAAAPAGCAPTAPASSPAPSATG